MSIRTAEIEIDMVQTYDPDTDPHDYLFQHPDYTEQDQARLAAWRNDEWSFVGVRAQATIKTPYGINPKCWISTTLMSPGLWGVESDSSEDYFQEVYRQEREILIAMLASLKSYSLIDTTGRTA